MSRDSREAVAVIFEDAGLTRVHCAIIQAHHKHILMQMPECACECACECVYVGVLVDKQNVIYYKRPRGAGQVEPGTFAGRRLWGNVLRLELSPTAARTWLEPESSLLLAAKDKCLSVCLSIRPSASPCSSLSAARQWQRLCKDDDDEFV